MRNLLLATGQPQIDNIIKDKIVTHTDYQVIGAVNYKKDLLETIIISSVDLVIISKNLTGKDLSILELILSLRTQCPHVRIIYLAGELDSSNKEKVNELATLVMAGVYDIVHTKSISPNILKDLIQTPKKKEQVQYLLRHLKTNVIYEDEIVDIEEEVVQEDLEENGYKNVFIVSSIKPGTGKTFISSNLATCLAKFGATKPDGSQIKVAIIEADLQNLSVGTIFQIENEKKNLKTVVDKIDEILDSEGNLIENELKIRMTNEFILNSFQQYKNAKNLYALVGSHLTMDEVENVKPIHYSYLIDFISNHFDIIIIDTNSSLAHTTTYPLLRMANTAFYVLDLDFNNVRNNTRYQSTLKEIDVFNKIKYVLNRDITKENRIMTNRTMLEDLEFNADSVEEIGFNLVSRVPELPNEIFLNRLFEGTPVILDEYDYTLKVRLEISKLAKEIWDIKNYDWLTNEFEKQKEKFFGEKKKGLFR